MTMRVSQVASWARRETRRCGDRRRGRRPAVRLRPRRRPSGSRARRERAGCCAAASTSRTPRDRPARRARRAPSRRGRRGVRPSRVRRRIGRLVTPCSKDARTRAGVPGPPCRRCSHWIGGQSSEDRRPPGTGASPGGGAPPQIRFRASRVTGQPQSAQQETIQLVEPPNTGPELAARRQALRIRR